MGTPFNIVIDNFNVKDPEVNNENDNSIRFHGTISKAGANRAVWVYPLYQAGNLVLYVAGFAYCIPNSLYSCISVLSKFSYPLTTFYSC